MTTPPTTLVCPLPQAHMTPACPVYMLQLDVDDKCSMTGSDGDGWTRHCIRPHVRARSRLDLPGAR
ncbi:MAG: hypothetical protein OWT27_07140, partial [Firmicutes bacterium]|nr:hypothetical protein [Bacillota bacterium]